MQELRRYEGCVIISLIMSEGLQTFPRRYKNTMKKDLSTGDTGEEREVRQSFFGVSTRAMGVG
jgi:hypothetical protein